MDVPNGKWKVVILARLKDRSYRYGELRALIPAMSDKMLTERLKDLENAGLVKRNIGIGNVREVAYEITKRGLSAGPALSALWAWGKELSEELSVNVGD